MKTKIILNVDGKDNELHPDCLANWEEVMCTYKRNDFSGVIRSCTSKFEFVNEAFDALLDIYLRDGINAIASVAVLTMNDDWSFNRDFECRLDFSSLSLSTRKLSISAIDDTVAAVIKSKKGTKYELRVGEDIESDGTFHFDRLYMLENVTYGFTQGESEEDSGAITVEYKNEGKPWLGSKGHETSVGGAVLWEDDQRNDDKDSCLLTALRNVEVTMKCDIVMDTLFSDRNAPIRIFAVQRRNGMAIASHTIGLFGGSSKYSLIGSFSHPSELPEMNGGSADDGKFALIDGIVWMCRYNGTNKCIWVNLNCTRDEYFQATIDETYIFNLIPGDKITMEASESKSARFRILSSAITFEWRSIGNQCDIPAFKPVTVLDALLNRMFTGVVNVYGTIRDNELLSDTVILAAESIRGMAGAKLYSTFQEFCDWIETVFGYTYYIGERTKSHLTSAVVMESFGFCSSPYVASSTVPPSDWDAGDILYNSAVGKFMLAKRGYWYEWDGDNVYNDPATGRPYTDRIYKIGNKYYYFKVTDGVFDKIPVEYKFSLEDISKDFQEIVFCHRSELFNAHAEVKTIASVKEVSFAIDKSNIYSTLEIGYDKKDYESINGRDEFNFNNTYSIDCTVSDKKLSMISKYRADSYGIEFAAQKRSAESTDDSADNDVFFVHCNKKGAKDFYAVRDITITGTLSDRVFNAAFSPLQCIMANAGYIGMQSDNVMLTFASSTGNSDIVIGEEPLNRDIEIDTPLMTVGTVEFNTDDMSVPDMDNIIEIVSDGMIFNGFIQEVEYHYAREEAVKYKLFVKEIQRC